LRRKPRFSREREMEAKKVRAALRGGGESIHLFGRRPFNVTALEGGMTWEIMWGGRGRQGGCGVRFSLRRKVPDTDQCCLVEKGDLLEEDAESMEMFRNGQRRGKGGGLREVPEG